MSPPEKRVHSEGTSSCTSSSFLGTRKNSICLSCACSISNPYRSFLMGSRNRIRAGPETLRRSDWSAEKLHLCATRESAGEKDGTEGEVGADRPASIFRFSSSGGVMWRRQPRRCGPSRVSRSRSLLRLWASSWSRTAPACSFPPC